MNFRQRLFLLILSVILLVLSFHKINIWILTWFGFVPFLFAIENLSYKKTFLFAYSAGFFFYLLVLFWLTNVTAAGWIALCMYLGVYFGIFGVAVKYFARFFDSHPIRSVLALASFWVVLEYIQANFLTGFGWALLGYSQYKVLPVIQIADITGVYGVSFMVIRANISIWRYYSEKKKRRVYILFSTFCLALVIGYGCLKIFKSFQTQNFKISVIQGNIPQSLYGKGISDELILDRYIAMTKEAAKDKPSLIIWPETVSQQILEEDSEILGSISRLAKEVDTALLAGAITKEELGYFNSAVLFSKTGNILGRYHKIHLVAFGEFIPLARYFPLLRSLAPIGDFTRGSEFVTFVNLDKKFSTLICFEDIFPLLSRKFVQGGADFLVNITNDAWFKISSAPYQHLANSVFRAVENRRPLVRAANTGISAFIDARGAIKDKISINGRDIFVAGCKTSNLPVLKNNIITFYTRFGDIFIILALFFVISLPIESLTRRAKARGVI